MTRITLEQANHIIAAGLEKAKQLDLKPLTIAVMDAGGHLLALQRQDGSSTLRPAIAMGKAGGALALGLSSRKIGEMADARPTFINAVAQIAPHGVVSTAGGVLVVDEAMMPIGAVGVTGDTSDKDEECALAGILAAGLKSQ